VRRILPKSFSQPQWDDLEMARRRLKPPPQKIPCPPKMATAIGEFM
jgi:hypothetical protein